MGVGGKLVLGLVASAALAARIGAQDVAVSREPRTVRVVVTQSLEKGEAPIAGVRVLVGCARERPSQSPPGANQPLATVTLDETGRAEVELELPGDVGAEPLYWAEVASDGFQRQLTSTLARGPYASHLALPVRRGGTLFGEVDAGPRDEKGWMGPRIRLVRAGAGASDAQLHARGDASGRFRAHFVELGRYHLQASWDGRGVAVMRDLALDPDAVPRVVRLDGAGGLELAGRILDPDGEPVPELEVTAVPEDVALPSELSADDWRNGFYGERVEAGPDGGFVVPRLPSGRYVLIGALQGARPATLSTEPVAAGARDALGIARVHRLALRVLDHDGRALHLGERDHPFAPRQAEDPLIFCRVGPRSDYDDTFLSKPWFLAGQEAIQPVEPGDEVLLAYAAPGVRLVERRVTVPERPWLVREELRLGPPVEPAVLRLRVTYRQRPFVEDCELSLLAQGGIDVVGARDLPEDGRVRVSPGSYRLRLTPSHWLFCWQGDPEELVPDFAPVEADVVLEAGEETTLELVVQKNARLRVELALPALGTAEEIEAALDTADFREPLRRAVGGAVLELYGADGAVVRPEFSVAVPVHPARPKLLAPWIAPGRECVSVSGIAPGEYRARAVLDDGRVFEGEVVLEESRVALLELRPAPQAR